MSTVQDCVERLGNHIALAMERLGLIDRRRAKRMGELVWPRIVTGFARLSQRTTDVAMVGIALGPAGIAGIAFASAFWQVGNMLSLGLSGGTVSLVSRKVGSGENEAVDRVIKLSAMLGLALAAPLALVFWFGASELVGLLSDSSASVDFGATYLQVMALGVVFLFLNKVGSRALIGANDARTPMIARSLGAMLNIALNALFLFGFGLGIAGVALGTVISLAFVTVVFAVGFLTGRIPGIGHIPVQVSLGGPIPNVEETRELLTISTPLAARRLVPVAAVFPVLAIASWFGPVVVAALEISRRIRELSNAPNWGFAVASSSLIGQQIGSGDGREARKYAWGILRVSVVVNVAVAVAVFAFAKPIAVVFVDDPAVLEQAVAFIRVTALSIVGLGIDNTVTGILRSNGDTRWPLYGKIVYAAAIPIAAIAAGTVGITALYALLIFETVAPAVFVFYRFWTGRWLPSKPAGTLTTHRAD